MTPGERAGATAVVDGREFDRWLRIGLGRPILTLQPGAAAPYREIILNACLHNLTLDRQLEGSQAPYLLDGIRRTGEEGYYRARILAALATAVRDPEADDADVDQLLDFGGLFAAGGDGAARATVYAAAAAWMAAGREFGLVHLIELDGLRGLEFITDHLGGETPTRPDEWAEEWANPEWVRVAEEREGSAAVWRTPQANPRLAALLAAVAADRAAEARPRPVPEVPAYEEIARQIGERGGAMPRSRLITFGRSAPDEAIALAAADLLAAREPGHRLAYLRIFRLRRFPLDPDRLLELAGDPDSEIAEAALAALAQVTHPAVRALALRLIAAAEHPAGAVGLLERNFEAGDYARMMKAAAAAAHDPEEYHALGYDALVIAKAHPTLESRDILLHLYEHDACSHCRERAVDLLHELGALPAWLVDECCYDSNFDLRVKARQYQAALASGAPPAG